jgi:hypothetical protein
VESKTGRVMQKKNETIAVRSSMEEVESRHDKKVISTGLRVKSMRGRRERKLIHRFARTKLIARVIDR